MDPTTTPSGARSATARAPALAYDNPQPRLPGSEADAPRQPETFVRRARRVRLGSHHLKTGYLALCTFGRGWVKEEDRIEIRMKRQTMAGELECRSQTLAVLLRDLQAAGVVEFCRSKYHTVVTLFCEPRPRVSAENAPTGAGHATPVGAESAPTDTEHATPVGAESAPTDTEHATSVGAESAPTDTEHATSVGAESAPPVGAESAPTKVFSTFSKQQQQDPPSKKQLRGIRSMGAELRAGNVDPFGSDDPQTRAEADETFRERKRQVTALRAPASIARRRRGQRNRPDLTDEEQRVYEASGGNPWAVRRFREDQAE